MADFASMIYGTAQQAAQEPGQGMQQALQQGASLALQKEQLDNAQAQMQIHKQQLEDAKIHNLYTFMGGAMKAQNANERQNMLKATVGYANAAGIDENKISRDGIMSLGTSEAQQRMYTLQTYTNIPKGQPGHMDAFEAIDLATNPLKRDKFMAIPPTPLEFMGKYADLSESQKFALKESDKADSTDTRIAGASDKAEAALTREIRSKFEPLSKEQAALTSAQTARDRVQAQLAKDPSGRSVSPQDMGAMVYSLLHTELGRVNQTELSDQLHIPGIENYTKDQLVKVLGGVNPNVVKGLVQRVNTAAQDLDERKQRLADAYAPDVADKPKAAAVRDAYMKNTYKPSGSTQKTVSYGGHDWPPDELKAAVAKGMASTDPAVKAKAAAAQAALTAAGVK